MDARKLLVAFLLVAMLASANAALSVTVNEPAARTYTPNLTDADKCFDVNVTIVDANAADTTFIANIYYNYGDNNTFIASDLNLDSGECSFATANVWTTPGADCVVRYCWSTHSPPSGTYVFDFNVHVPVSDVNNYHGQGIQVVGLDNRYVSTAIGSLLQAIPIVLVAAILIVVVLGLTGVLSPMVVMGLLPTLVILLIALTIIARLLLTLEGKA